MDICMTYPGRRVELLRSKQRAIQRLQLESLMRQSHILRPVYSWTQSKLLPVDRCSLPVLQSQMCRHPTWLNILYLDSTHSLSAAYRNEVYYSNRAAAYISLKQYTKAIQDARRVIAIRPKWAKGHARLAAAHFALQDYSEVS